MKRIKRLSLLKCVIPKDSKKDINKVIKLIDEDEYGILEGFVYDYKMENWLRYPKDDAGLMTQTSFSEVLHLDLSLMLA